MPWMERYTHRGGLKGRKRFFRFGADSIRPGSRDPSGRLTGGTLRTQGIGLRPQPWAGISRPFGLLRADESTPRGVGPRASPDPPGLQ